jgi:hypothetical protein
VLAAALGGSGALIAAGGAVLAYALVVLRGAGDTASVVRPSEPAVAGAVPAR